MGMYTELAIGVEFKKDTPPRVIAVLEWMVTNHDHEVCEIPLAIDHLLFKTDRWAWMLRNGGSYYFDAKPCLVWKLDEITKSYFLTVWRNIKNYTFEWENFLDFIAPYLATEGFIGHYRYEECENPTLIYNLNGKIEMRCYTEGGPDCWVNEARHAR